MTSCYNAWWFMFNRQWKTIFFSCQTLWIRLSCTILHLNKGLNLLSGKSWSLFSSSSWLPFWSRKFRQRRLAV